MNSTNVMTKKSAFTLIELVLVLMTIGLLVMGMVSFLSDRSTKQKYQAEICFNQLSQQLDNFVNAALMGKKLQTAWYGEEYPNYYEITLSGENLIELNYRTWGASVKYMEIFLTGNCNQKGLYLSMTGATFSGVVMNKWFRLLKPGENSAFSLSWTTFPFTWEVQFRICAENGGENPCFRDVGRRYIDARVQTIFIQKCQFYLETDTEKCAQREGS